MSSITTFSFFVVKRTYNLEFHVITLFSKNKLYSSMSKDVRLGLCINVVFCTDNDLPRSVKVSAT